MERERGNDKKVEWNRKAHMFHVNACDFTVQGTVTLQDTPLSFDLKAHSSATFCARFCLKLDIIIM